MENRGGFNVGDDGVYHWDDEAKSDKILSWTNAKKEVIGPAIYNESKTGIKVGSLEYYKQLAKLHVKSILEKLTLKK